MRDIGKNIRTLRETSALTQDQLAERLHVTRQTISNYETGRSRPDVDMLLAIAEVLGADMNAVLYGTVPAGRKENLLRFIIIAVVTAILCTAYALLHPWAEQMRTHQFIVAPIFFVRLYLMPGIGLLLGWLLMQGCGIWLNARPLSGVWVKYGRRSLIALTAGYFILILPFMIWLIWDAVEVLRLMAAHAEFQRSSQFVFLPGWGQLATVVGQWVYQKSSGAAMALFSGAGMALWAFELGKVHAASDVT